MKKILLPVLICVSGYSYSQITSPTASGTTTTAYTSGAPNDNIYIFCTPDADNNPVTGSLTSTGSGGTAPYTFTWEIYNTGTNSFDPLSIEAGVLTSTINGLASGGYKVKVVDAVGTVMFCDIAWVFVNQTNVDAGTLTPTCGGTITLGGSVSAVANFVYYNPPPEEFLITPTTEINVCFNANHTWVSDLGFYLVGPASCGSPTILLSPNPGAVGLGTVCNMGDNVNGLCFSNTTASVFAVCTAPTPLTGTYGAYATSAGSLPINWTTLVGCDAAAGGWRVQIYDCISLDVGSLTGASITFFDPVTGAGSCTSTNAISYNSGVISSAINDNSCTAASASIYTVPFPPTFTTPITLNNSITSFLWTASTGTPVPGASSNLTPTLPAPIPDTWYYLQANDNFGCTRIDSVFFDNTCDCNITASVAVSACDPSDNTYDVTGNLVFTYPPSTGTLIVTSSCGGSQTFNAPFTSPQAYSITGLNSDGLPCTITAVFSDSTFCTTTVGYTAPADCTPECDISSVTAVVNSCSPTTNTYAVSGNITFTVPPATGTLTVTSSCGSTQTFTAPFTSPQAYSFTGLPGGTGTCTITATFSADAGCTNSVTYTVPTPPVANPVAGMCINAATVNLTGSPAGGAWVGPGTTSAGVFNAALAGAGTHAIVYAATAACPLTDTIYIQVNPLPVVTAPADQSICTGESVVLNVTGTATTFSWTPATGLSSTTSSSPTANPGSTTTYTVTGTDAIGCSNTDAVTVTVNTAPVINVTPGSTICRGDGVTLTATGAATYSWSPSTGLSAPGSGVTVAFPSTTTTYTVTGTDANGCSSTATVTMTVIDPNAAFTPSPETGTPPLTVNFDNNSNGTIYYWNFGNGSGDTTNNVSPDASTTYPTVGNYIVTLVSIQGPCSDTTTFTIIVYPSSSLIVPNIITANGDGMNDEFKVTSTALASLSVQIFNRWGQQVGSIGSPSESWNGNDHAAGTYFYVLKAVGEDDVVYEQQGNFTLAK